MNTFNFDDEMKELLDSFLVETHELLDVLDQDLMKLETQPNDTDLLNSIFRSFHTIKGTSSFMGFDQMTEVTHHAEDLLNKLRRSELTVTTDMVDTLLAVYDILVRLLTNVENGAEEKIETSDIIEKIYRCSNPSPDADSSGAATAQSAQEQPKSAVDTILSLEGTVSPTDEFTQDELRMVEQAFSEINNSFSSQTKDSPPEQDSAVSTILKLEGTVSPTDEFTQDELRLVEQAFNEINSSFSSAAAQTPSAPTENSGNKVGKEAPPPSSVDATATASSPEKPSEQPTDDDSSLVVTRRAVNMYSQAQQDDNKQNTPPIEIKAEPQHRAENTLRVDVQRLEALMDLSGELVLGRNRLAQITERLTQQFEDNEFIQELVKTSAEINYITSELQSAIMKTRMVPIGKLYQKAPRMIRELSREFNKDIELIIQGEDTEVDRSIIEELGDPLVHMIRNSCDHGIETPNEREKAGKPRKGTIRLTAEHEGNHIVVRIMDNGKGMNAEFLKNKAIDKGIITPDQAAQMTDQDAFNLIFAAGFSTAEKVTNVSGRGVGMDVVRTNIQKLKGTIHIDSQIGQGSVFTIKLPLTLAIIQGLLVRAWDEIYALPLSSVIEVVSAQDNKISTVQQSEVIRIRDQVYPLLRLESVLSIPSARNQERGDQYVVLVGLAEQRIGIVTDELLGQKEIVVKSLGDYLEDVPGIAGSTILGDGRVIMILDIADIFNSNYSAKKTVPALAE